MSINKNYTKLDQKIIILLVAYPNRFTIGELPDIFYENTTRVKESINKIMGSGHLLKDDITGGLSIDIKLNVIWATEIIQKVFFKNINGKIRYRKERIGEEYILDWIFKPEVMRLPEKAEKIADSLKGKNINNVGQLAEAINKTNGRGVGRYRVSKIVEMFK